MTIGLEQIADKEYVGRINGVGMDISGKNIVAFNAVTVRSDPEARTLKLDEKNNVVYTEPTGDSIRQPGLLIYPAMMVSKTKEGKILGIISTNGFQTNLINSVILALDEEYGCETSAQGYLDDALADPFYIWDKSLGFVDIASFEPDAPNYTQRVSSLCAFGEEGVSAGFAICTRKNNGKVSKQSNNLNIDTPGIIRAISTYSGKNVPKGEPIPRFEGKPYTIGIEGHTPDEVAKEIYDALGPKSGEGIVQPGKDFRVGVAVCFYNMLKHNVSFGIVNRNK
jgi:hypothetical protein